MHTVLEILGWIATGAGTIGVIVGAAWGVFKVLGQKWIDERFAKRLEAFRHEQQQELEQLRLPHQHSL